VIYLVVASVVALALGALVFRRVDDRVAVEV
jgi:ABC-type polysaccharide/polyol phosphate export permease